MSEKKTVTGGCLCGAVQFSIELPSKWCAHCHCSMCRKGHGAGYVTWVGLESDQFHLGEQAGLEWFSSSDGARRGFCRRCGSSMLFQSVHWAGEMHVALGCIEGAIDRRPQAHAFYDSHVEWVPLDEALPIVKG